MKRIVMAVALMVLLAQAGQCAPQSTAFTYQGSLNASGLPANGNFDLKFTLFDSAAGNTQVGSTITLNQFPVVNGKFTIDLDFPGAFTGNQLWLEVMVGAQTLTPRQPVNSVPVAQYALAAPNPGAIIPLSSGVDRVTTTLIDGSSADRMLMGFGASATFTQSGPTLDLTGGLGANLNFAFSVPRNGTISSMSAYFSSTGNVFIGSGIAQLTGQLYASTTPNNVFLPIPGASVTFNLPQFVSVGTTANGIAANLSIPVTAQTRLLFVGSASVAGGFQPYQFPGYWSAGINIQ